MMMTIAIFACVVVLGTALWRMVRDTRAGSVAVTIAALCYCIVLMLAAMRFHGYLPAVDDRLTNNALGYIKNYLGDNLQVVLSAVIVVVNAFVACAIWWRMPLRWFVAIVVAGFLLLGCAMSLFTSTSPLVTLFGTCCAFMAAVGYALGLTYKEFCVIGNNYVQAGLVAALALWLAVESWVVVKRQPSFASWLAAALSSLLVCAYGKLFWVICTTYRLPLESAFDQCVKDLYHLADIWHTTYYHVNIIVYVIAFVAAISCNVVAIWLQHRSWGRWPAVALMVAHIVAVAAVAASWSHVTMILV